jgi:hypothetical protein
LQSDDQGDSQLELLGCLDDSLGDDVASHDTTDCKESASMARLVRTNVDKDRFHVLGRQQELKGLLDSVGGSTSTNVQLTVKISTARVTVV